MLPYDVQPSAPQRDIHPVFLMSVVGTIVGMATCALGIPPIFGRPAAILAAAITWLVLWFRLRQKR